MSYIYSLSLSHNTIASGRNDGIIKIWNIDTDQCIQTLVKLDKAITCLIQLSVNTIMRQNVEELWNVTNGDCLKTFPYNETRGSVSSLISLK
jgi:WD40 repeat protein